MKSLEKYEIAYFNLGWRLFPVKRGNKHPITKNGYKDATNDPTQYQKECDGKMHNIGLATGKQSGVWVLDVDIAHGGEESLNRLQKQFGKIPNTVKSKTQSGGSHLYFQCQENMKLTNRVNVRPGIDIRADGGYVVLPPSKGPKGFYEWLYPPVRTEIAAAPTWLVQMVTKQSVKSNNDGLMSTLADGLTEGSRNMGIAQLAGLLLSHGLNITMAWMLTSSYNKNYCIPPLDDQEILKIFQSIANRELIQRHRWRQAE
ncbi:DNA primase [Alicyclobacillaceae bacterium I2511]|nr:DNA primase [Alicyclobacillaceae bacterium I2511]